MSLARQLPDGIVFDLDGTLWDATVTIAEAWDAAVRRRHPGHPPLTLTAVRGVMGLSHRALLQQLFPQHPIDEQDVLAALCYAEEDHLLRHRGGTVYPYVAEGLAALAATFPLFIVSNCQAGYIETFLDVTRLQHRFRDHECHGNTNRPKGENLVSVLQRNSLRSALMVGDTTGDQDAARFAGVPFLHAGYGFGAVPDPDAACADFTQVVRTCLAWGK